MKSLLGTTGGFTKQPVWLLLQVKRDTLQATKYVELLLVADYAEVRNGIFVPREHWAQGIPPAASLGQGGLLGLSRFSFTISMILSRQGELCLGHFCPGSHHCPGRDADLDEG